MKNDPTFEQKLSYVKRRFNPGAWFGVGLAAISFVFVPFITQGPPGVLVALGVFTLALLAYCVWYFWGGSVVKVEPDVTFVFRSEDAYIEPWRLKRSFEQWGRRVEALSGAEIIVSVEFPKYWASEDGEATYPGGEKLRAETVVYPKSKTIETARLGVLSQPYWNVELDKIARYHNPEFPE